ncbi:hypothetical protein OROHE_015269 [Orobanche hederae]
MVPPLEAEEILTYIKKPSKRIGLALYSKLYVHSNVVQKKRVAWILFFKIRPSQDILKIRDGTPLEAEGILTYIKNPRNGTVWHFYSKLYVPSNVVQKKGVTRILFFKIRPSQEILKIHDGTPLEMLSQEILKNRDGTPLDAEEILTYIKKSLETDWPSQEILKIHDEILKNCDGTPLEAEEILTYIKNPRNGSVWHFSSPRNRLSQEILKNRDVARILFSKIRPSQEILKNRDGTPLEAEEILTYIKDPRNGFVCKLDVPSNIVQKKRVAQILLFKIRLSQEILKNRDKPSQEILKNCDGTPLEAEEILTYIKNPRNGSVWHFSSKLYVPSNVVQKKRVARILFFKIRPSQEILKIHDGTPLEAEEILTYIKRLSQEILKNRDGTHLEAEEILTYIKKALETDWPSQEILKNRDGTPLEEEEILTYIKDPRNGSV